MKQPVQFNGGGSVVVYSLFSVAPNVWGGSVFGICFVHVLTCSVLSSFAIILMGKRMSVVLL